MPHAGHVSRCGIIPQEKHNRVAGGEVHQHENKKGNPKENRHGADDPASDRCHLSLKSRTASLSISVKHFFDKATAPVVRMSDRVASITGLSGLASRTTAARHGVHSHM